jgi:hypothetical protein
MDNPDDLANGGEELQSARFAFLSSLPKDALAEAIYNMLSDRMNEVTEIISVLDELGVFSEFWNNQVVHAWMKHNREFALTVLRAFKHRACEASNASAISQIDENLTRVLNNMNEGETDVI